MHAVPEVVAESGRYSVVVVAELVDAGADENDRCMLKRISKEISFSFLNFFFQATHHCFAACDSGYGAFQVSAFLVPFDAFGHDGVEPGPVPTSERHDASLLPDVEVYALR